MDSIQELKGIIENFVKEREWNRFHSPKNLAMALSGEAAEILELFQWLTEEEIYNLDEDKREKLKQEIGDVMVYLLNLSSKFGIDPVEAGIYKMGLNGLKYPVEKAKGNAKKYNEF